LVRAAQAGDRAALDALLRRHHDRIHGVCRRLAGNDADAWDATQDALIAIARGIHRFDGRAAFTTWSYRVATNACLDELRRRRRRPVPGLAADLDDDGFERGGLSVHAGNPAADGTLGLDRVPEQMAVEEALAQLPIEFRAPVVLRDLCDLDYAEIADVLDIPPGTVRSRIARGRAQLARALGERNQPDPSDRPTQQTAPTRPPTGPTT
jgi:RNA polymerase sigma-70 factor (ECF subfamily)